MGGTPQGDPLDNPSQHQSGVFLLRPMVEFYSGVDNALKSEATGCRKGQTGVARHGTEHGSIQKLDKHAAHLLARLTFQKRN